MPMTPDQEQMAEKVIQFHKDGNGIYDWKNFKSIFDSTDIVRLIVGKALREKGIIGDFNQGTILTEYGWTFQGFQKERDEINRKDSIEKEINSLTLRKLKLEQFPVKFWWLIVLLTAIISILTTWISNRIEESAKPVIHKEQFKH